MHKIRARLYQGIKPVGQPVTVQLEQSRFRIILEMEDSADDLFWEVDGIHPDPSPGDGKFILSYGERNPKSYLEFEDPATADLLIQEFPGKIWEAKPSIVSKHALAWVLSIVAVIFLILAVVYFWGLPRVADQVARKVPLDWEIKLGKQIEAGMLKDSHVDSIRSSQLDSFFKLMNVPSGYAMRFYFVKDSIVNAFAIPGGTIVVYEGLFDRLNDYEALAGLLGHEFAHVELRHSLRSMFRSLSGYMLLSVLFGDLTGLTGILLDNAHSIQNLSYSRDFEQDADLRSIELLLERNIGLSGMYSMFKIFLNESPKGIELPEFMRSHPVTEKRMEQVEKAMGNRESSNIERRDLNQLFTRMKQN